jgi:4-hydroxybenzoate polyprenyltransferase
MVSLKTLLKMMRPTSWGPYFFGYAIGVAVAAPLYSNLSPFTILVALVALAASLGFIFSINFVYDIDVDKYHDGSLKDLDLRKQPLLSGELTIAQAKIFSWFLFFLSFVGLFVNSFYGAMILLNSILGILYSIPPFRFKARPFLDIFINVMSGSVLLYFAGASLQIIDFPIIVVIAGALIGASWYYPTVIADYDFDKRAKLMTTAVFFGGRNAFRVWKYLYYITLISIVWLVLGPWDYAVKLPSLLAIPMGVYLFSVRNKPPKQKFKRINFWKSYSVPAAYAAFGLTILAILRYRSVIP